MVPGRGACQGVLVVEAPRTPVNPWMVGLTVLWSLVLLGAIVLALLGAGADTMTYDEPGLPPSDELAGIYYASSGVAAAVAVVIIGVQLGVGALRWHLDPGSRALATEAAAERLRRARQDF